MNIQLEPREPSTHGVDELATTLLARFGLLPRKRDSAATMHQLLLELTEKKKEAIKHKQPELGILTVEEMGKHAGIARQTMYDYLSRWLSLHILKKSSFVQGGKVIIGYELNGTSLESAFRKAETVIKNHVEQSFKILDTMQKEIKREKLKRATSSE
ncbi:hypothetical protein GF342_02630 [Candidatus Woesearchaeota archaeon]|nr:hypothetical protein [Candidatus Woesearchaeota archaeon]